MIYTITNKRNKHLSRVSTDMLPINIDENGNSYFQSSILVQFSTEKYFEFNTYEEAKQFLQQFVGQAVMDFANYTVNGKSLVLEIVEYFKTLKITQN